MTTVTATRDDYVDNFYGPLTTTFKQRSSCAVLYRTGDSNEPVTNGMTCSPYTRVCSTVTSSDALATTSSCTDSTSYSLSDDLDCYPRGSTTGGTFVYPGFYSPGLICPESYETACTTTQGGEGNYKPTLTLNGGETAAACCPMGFRCEMDDNDWPRCRTTVSSTEYQESLCPDYDFSTTTLEWGTRPTEAGFYVSNTGDYITTLLSVVVEAPLIQLVWQESDLSGLPTSTTAMTLPAPTDSDDSEDLSTGAKAGIGLGSAFIGMILIGALIWFWRRKRREQVRTASSQMTPVPDGSTNDKSLERGDQQPWN